MKVSPDVELIVSDEGYGANDYIKTERPLVIVPAQVQEAVKWPPVFLELIRRFLRYQCEYTLGLTTQETVQRAELLMKEFNMCPADRAVVSPAQQVAKEAVNDPRLGSEGIYVGAAIELAMEKLAAFRDCEMHMTHMPSPGDEEGIRRLGINLTTDPLFASDDLYTM